MRKIYIILVVLCVLLLVTGCKGTYYPQPTQYSQPIQPVSHPTSSDSTDALNAVKEAMSLFSKSGDYVTEAEALRSEAEINLMNAINAKSLDSVKIHCLYAIDKFTKAKSKYQTSISLLNSANSAFNSMPSSTNNPSQELAEISYIFIQRETNILKIINIEISMCEHIQNNEADKVHEKGKELKSLWNKIDEQNDEVEVLKTKINVKI